MIKKIEIKQKRPNFLDIFNSYLKDIKKRKRKRMSTYAYQNFDDDGWWDALDFSCCSPSEEDLYNDYWEKKIRNKGNKKRNRLEDNLDWGDFYDELEKSKKRTRRGKGSKKKKENRFSSKDLETNDMTNLTKSYMKKYSEAKKITFFPNLRNGKRKVIYPSVQSFITYLDTHRITINDSEIAKLIRWQEAYASINLDTKECNVAETQDELAYVCDYRD
jgi:hypothetical protein